MKNKFYLLLLQALLPCFIFAQNYSFTRVASCPEALCCPASFTVGDSLFVVGGCIGNVAFAPKNLTQHVWLYNTTLDTWTRKADFPGLAVYNPSSFVINGLCYLVNGWDSTETGAGPNTLWQYDPQADSWTTKAAFPGQTRYTAASFALNGKGYVGLGFKPLVNDFWQYDPATDAWTQKANFPGVARQAPVWFTMGNYAYVGLGAVGDNFGGFYLQSDFYKYDPATDTWTTLGIFPGDPITTRFSFTINNEAYVVDGGNENSLNYQYLANSNRVWKYIPATDTWSLWGLFPDSALSQGAVGQANGAGYMGLGILNSVTYPLSNKFYRFGPGAGTYSCNATIAALQVNNATRNFEALGNFAPTAIVAWNFGDGSADTGTSVNHAYTTTGSYNVTLTVSDAGSGCSNTESTTVLIANIANCGVTVSNTSISSTFTLIANTTGVGPYTYLWSHNGGNAFSTSPDPLVNIGYGDSITYCVLITDSTGCSTHACQTITDTNTASITCQTYLYIYPDSTVPGLYYGAVYHTGAGGTAYYWSFGDGTGESDSTDAFPYHVYASPGLYTICLTIVDANNCTSHYCDSSFYAYKVGGGPMHVFEVVTNTATGIAGVAQQLQLSVYPNPASDALVITANNKIDYLSVYTTLGQKVKEQAAPLNNTINIQSLAAGIYFIDVRIGTKTGRVKFVKTN